MSEVDLEHLHKLQLDLALEVKRICEKHNITYFLVDGSALGAVNLHDFLPWDDDLDIGMYWPDYQKFLKVCKTELPGRYKMKDFMTDDSFGCCFGQLIDTEVELIQENNQTAGDEKGVFIDIHPFSNCSQSPLIRRLEYYRFKIYKLCMLQRRKYISDGSKVVVVLRFLNKLYSEDGLKKRILKMRNQKVGKYALKIHGRHPEDYIVIDNLNKLSQVEFAKEVFPLQPDARRMLDQIYGPFDITKKEDNRHSIISMKFVGGVSWSRLLGKIWRKMNAASLYYKSVGKKNQWLYEVCY